MNISIGRGRESFYLAGQVGGKCFSVHAEGDQFFITRETSGREEVRLVPPDVAPNAAPPPIPPPVGPDGSPRPLFEPLEGERAPGSSPLYGMGFMGEVVES